jgi:pyruvate formate lyase activating enzyme
MQVNLGGIIHLSTVDWTGSATTVIFLRGCPLRCPHCQNCELQTGESLADISLVQGELRIKTIKPAGFGLLPSSQITLEKAISLVDARTNEMPSDALISGIVISGGEPLMQPLAVRAIAQNAKDAGLKVGLETCGYYPDRLAPLLEDRLVDRVFMDVKAALRDPEYERATGLKNVASRVLESLRACMKSRVALEVRTTVFPQMPSSSEVAEIARKLSELKKEIPNSRFEHITLQRGLPRAKEFIPISSDELNSMVGFIEGLVKVEIRESLKAKPISD